MTRDTVGGGAGRDTRDPTPATDRDAAWPCPVPRPACRSSWRLRCRWCFLESRR